MVTDSGPTQIPVELIERDPRAWPRRALDHDRVAEFISLYEEGGVSALPPVEVVVDGEGSALLYDGHHRIEALLQLGVEEVLAFYIELADGQDAIQVAFERAVATSSTSAKPLTRAERRTAVVRMLEANADRSDREIARIAAVSPTTVGNIRREIDAPRSDHHEPSPDAEEEYVARVTAKELARRAFKALERVRETKGLGVADRLLGDRTSERFARVLRNEFGEDALDRAQEYRTWIDGAIRHLKEVGET